MATFFKSPVLIAMALGGVALVLGVPYLALRTLPGIANPITGETSAPTGNQNAGIDFQELNNLPPNLIAGASTILSQEEAVMPLSLTDLPEANGFGLIFPVTEAVESVQPTFTWTAFAPGPYKIVVRDRDNKVVANNENVRSAFWVIPVKLEQGATYSWQVTAANQESQSASFVVLGMEELGDWLRVRSKFKDSHLALGLAAEELGMLSTAEREYQELARQFPNAEAPGRLLANVLSLRE